MAADEASPETAGPFTLLVRWEKDSNDFNRNAVLHGANVEYGNEENSLVLILTLLEIRTFLWFEKNTSPVV